MLFYTTSVFFFTPAENAEPDELIRKHSGSLKMLWECGFRSPQKEKLVVTGIEEVIKHVHDFEEMRIHFLRNRRNGYQGK